MGDEINIIKEILNRFNWENLEQYPKKHYIEAIKEIKEITNGR